MNESTFLGLSGKLAALHSSRFVVLPISYDKTASYLKGTAKAPSAIIEASIQAELFDEYLLDEFYHCGIHTHPDIGSNKLSPHKMQEKIFDTAKKLTHDNKTIIGLGGEHSISIGLIKAAAQKHKDISVLQIDAHADLRNEYEGTKLSHACVMRRIYEMDIPAVGVGIRSFCAEQFEFMQNTEWPFFSPNYIQQQKDWIDAILYDLTDDVYLTLDIDGLDPSIAPGTGTPEPGGLTYQQIHELIMHLGRKKNIIGADIVEVIPNTAGVITEFLAARLAYKIIAASQMRD